MFVFISTMVVIWLVMWAFVRFMYPKPPEHYYPQEGDVIEPRNCDYCGHSVEEYRGVLEPKLKSENEEKERQKSEEQESEELGHELQESNVQEHETPDETPTEIESDEKSEDEEKLEIDAWFFCNYEHQASFHEERSEGETKAKIESEA